MSGEIGFLGDNFEFAQLSSHVDNLHVKPICEMASSSDVIKPEVFNGVCFKRWHIKTRMWLTDLTLFWVVSEGVPEVAADDADVAAKATAEAEKAKWEEANQACLSRLLNILSNRLFDVSLFHLYQGALS